MHVFDGKIWISLFSCLYFRVLPSLTQICPVLNAYIASSVLNLVCPGLNLLVPEANSLQDKVSLLVQIIWGITRADPGGLNARPSLTPRFFQNHAVFRENPCFELILGSGIPFWDQNSGPPWPKSWIHPWIRSSFLVNVASSGNEMDRHRSIPFTPATFLSKLHIYPQGTDMLRDGLFGHFFRDCPSAFTQYIIVVNIQMSHA